MTETQVLTRNLFKENYNGICNQRSKQQVGKWDCSVCYQREHTDARPDNAAQSDHPWNEVAPIKLVQRQGQSNYLEFINGQANYGGRAVGGPNSGRATISMDFRWGDNGNENIVIRALMHEIGHIVSLIHEHQRPDRDQYINILNDPNNGDTAVRYDGLLVEPYDCVSIMHYVPVGAATDPMPKPGGCQNFGRLNDPSLSSGDLAALKFLYPDKWDNWHQLGVEQIASGPAVCSWAPGRLDVFARGTDNTLYTKSWNGREWDNWHQHGI